MQIQMMVHVFVYYGCTNITAFNYNPDANTDDGSCVIYGCTINATMWNYNSNANTDDGSCVAFAYGCNRSNGI